MSLGSHLISKFLGFEVKIKIKFRAIVLEDIDNEEEKQGEELAYIDENVRWIIRC